jgi:hypothetical protein
MGSPPIAFKELPTGLRLTKETAGITLGLAKRLRWRTCLWIRRSFPNAANLQQQDQLGSLKVTKATGDTDRDGDLDQLFPHGARSFSIWTEDGALAFDSGDAFEQITAEEFPDGFNAQDAVDDRSDDKGPEPEGIVLGEVSARTYGFIGLERTGGIMVYDISDPFRPSFVQYINTRILGGDRRQS